MRPSSGSHGLATAIFSRAAPSPSLPGLLLLREGSSTRVPDRWLHALAPRGLRRVAVGRYVSHIADVQAQLRVGWRWVTRQTVLCDDLSRWARGVALYAGARAVELALHGRAPTEEPR